MFHALDEEDAGRKRQADGKLNEVTFSPLRLDQLEKAVGAGHDANSACRQQPS